MEVEAISTLTGISTLTNGVFVIDVVMGIRYIALKYVSGTVTIAGSLELPPLGITPNGSASSTPIVLDDTGFEMSTENPMTGVTIDATLGSVIIAFNK